MAKTMGFFLRILASVGALPRPINVNLPLSRSLSFLGASQENGRNADRFAEEIRLHETGWLARRSKLNRRAEHPSAEKSQRIRLFRPMLNVRGGSSSSSQEGKSIVRDGNRTISTNATTTGEQRHAMEATTLTLKGIKSGKRVSQNMFMSSSTSSEDHPISVCSAQGFRSYMEDEWFVSNDGKFAAVFDGHGGEAVSKYLRQNLYAKLLQSLVVSETPENEENDDKDDSGLAAAEALIVNPKPLPSVDDYKAALNSALLKVDQEVQQISHWSYQGSTAVAIWIHENEITSEDTGDDDESNDRKENAVTPPRRTIVAANVGDSRAVLCRNRTAWDLTRDHKPNDPIERERIERLGGSVVWCGETIYRVNGNLALARAIGDRSERPAVTADPEIIRVGVDEEKDQFIIIASDGLWDVMTSQESISYVLDLLEQEKDRSKIAALVVEQALRLGTYDNISVVIVWLDS